MGAALFAFGDIVYLRQLADDRYVTGTMLDATWMVGILLFGLAPWMPGYRRQPSGSTRSAGVALVPWVAAATSLAVIGWSLTRPVPELAVWLAMASIATVLVRIGLSLHELRLANEAWIAELAGIENRPSPDEAGGSTLATAARRPTGPALASLWLVGLGTVAVTALVGVGILVWQLDSDRPDDAATTSASVPDRPMSGGLQGEVDALRLSLAGLGLLQVRVELRDPVIHLSGEVPSTNDLAELMAVVDDVRTRAEVDTSAVVVAEANRTTTAENERRAAMQRDLDRLLAFTPIVFQTGQSELNPLQTRVLNNVAALMISFPGIEVRVVGYTDKVGSPEANDALSTARAEAVRAYLVSQGVPEPDLRAEGRGEGSASGSADLAGLERRVEFEVLASTLMAASTDILQVGIVAPSASSDLAFTQSIVDAVTTLGQEQPLELEVADNIVLKADAEVAARGFAEQGYRLVVVHGAPFGSFVSALAAEFPTVVFAWGPVADEPTQPNVYTYTAAAEQGGYVLGAVAAALSPSGNLAVIGPIEAGDDQRYAEGFQAGARAQRPEATVNVVYTGSPLDPSLAAEAAWAQVAAGADVLAGSGPMVVGAVSVAAENDLA